MARNRGENYSYRIGSTGGDQVKAKLQEIGAAGEAAGRRLERASQGASAGALRLDRAVSAVQGKLRTTAQTIAVLDGPLGGVASRFSSTASVIGGVGLVAGGAALAIGALSAGLVASVRVAEASERSQLRLQGVLRATGNAAGRTAADIDKTARDLGIATLTSANEARDAAAVLLTFRSIQEENFDRTLRVAQDVSAVFGQSLSSSVTQLGKALEDPIQGLSALRRVGISFSSSQREVIRGLVQTGDVAEAQRKILEALEQQVGGAGVAEAGGLTGALDTLGENLREISERFAEVTGAADLARAAVGVLNENADVTLKQLTPETTVDRLAKARREVDDLRKSVERLESSGFGGGAEAQDRRARLERVSRNLEELIERRREEARVESLTALGASRDAQSARNDLKNDQEAERAGKIAKIVEGLERERDAIGQNNAQKRLANLLAEQASAANDAERASIAAILADIDKRTAAEKRRTEALKESQKAERDRLERQRQGSPFNSTEFKPFDPFALEQALPDDVRKANRERDRAGEKFADLRRSLSERQANQNVRESGPDPELRLAAMERENELRRAGIDLQDEQVQKYLEESEALDRRSVAFEAQQERIRAVTDTIVDSVVEVALEGGKAIDVVKSLVAELAKVALRTALTKAVTIGVDAFFGGATGGGDAAAGNSNFILSAKGNVFARGEVVPFAKGGVVERPVIFPMAKGAGLMGEAGPEAIVPLRRDAQGRLGVAQPAVAGGGAVQVTVIDQRGAGAPDIGIEEKNLADGTKAIRLIIKREVRDQLAGEGGEYLRRSNNLRPSIRAGA